MRERHDRNFAALVVPFAEVHLIERGNRRTFREVPNSWADGLVAGLALTGKQWRAVLQHHEIDFAPVGIPEEPQFHAVAFDVLLPVTELQQL